MIYKVQRITSLGTLDMGYRGTLSDCLRGIAAMVGGFGKCRSMATVKQAMAEGYLIARI